MNKIFKNVVLLVVLVGVLLLIPLFLMHDSPLEVNIPQLNAQEIAAKKAEAERAEKQSQRAARIRKMYVCQEDEDCIIIDKDPCGCAAGPQGVTAINVNFLTQFNEENNQQGAKACPDTVSTEQECSASAKAVCVARVCKIQY